MWRYLAPLGLFIVLVVFLSIGLKLDPREFFHEARPTWKLAIRFLWGPRERFHYSFRRQADLQ